MSHTQQKTQLSLSEVRHPDFIFDAYKWAEWRDTFEGGDNYLDQYLMKFSDRETAEEFRARKQFTPIPTFAKAAVLDVRNSIFQRLEDILRQDGSPSYHKAAEGEDAGVDRKGSSMNSFIGVDVLTELLVMGRVGIYIDAPNKLASTLADEVKAPYLYHYRIEDVLNFKLSQPEENGQFQSVVLRDHVLDYTTIDGAGTMDLPTGRRTRRRVIWKSTEDGIVRCKMWDEETGEIIPLKDAAADGSIELGIPIVPFIMPTIGDSLLKDVASYQRALLNLVSADVNYALRSNTPFLTVQAELRSSGAHLKKQGESATPGGQSAVDATENVGAGSGRYYDVEMDRPGYIAPPTAPLEASMNLQEKLEDDIRKLINLAVSNKVGSRTESAEAKKLSSQGLEAGLSFIGTVLQSAEQQIARIWALYENPTKPQTATVAYPTRYILKEDKDRIEEAQDLIDLMAKIPGHMIKKQIAKQVVTVLLSGKLKVEELQAIRDEIDRAGYTTSELELILESVTAGLVSDELASEALGFKDGEVEQARKDKAKKAELVLAAQTTPGDVPANPASRGVPELDTDPKSGEKEQKAGREDADK